MNKILIPTKLETLAKEILEQAGYTVVQDATTPLLEQIKQHADAVGLIVRSEKITAEIIDAMPQLKLIVRAGAGFDTIDIAYARATQVDVMNTPGANANAVAEEVVTMVLAHFRHIVRGDVTTRAGAWEKATLMGSELTGKTVGIVGLGNIGRLVARRMKGFDVKILGYDPVLAPGKARDLGIEPCTLEEIFTRADVITLHVPGGADTKNMVSVALLSSMREDAVLVNCARFGVVDEPAMRQLKEQGKRIAYLTDVYPEDKAGDKPVADIADLMLPHLGASTIEANLTAARRAAEQSIAYFEHGTTACVVNKGTPDGLAPIYQKMAWMLACVARKWLHGTSVRKIDATFYGELHGFGRWFWSPVLAGLNPNFERGSMPAGATKALAEQGIDVLEREPQGGKPYGNSMTLDFLAGDSVMNTLSIRGTVAEDIPMVSRLGSFQGLYVALDGHSLFMHYKDRPGVIAAIAATLAEHNINIENISAPRDTKAQEALAVLKVNTPVPSAVVREIAQKIDALHGFAISL